MQKQALIGLTLLLLAALISYLFWQQQLQYLRPTPIPKHYQAAALQQFVALDSPQQAPGKAVLLHFFNPHCPCSRFSTDHFVTLAKTWGKQVSFRLVVQNSADTGVVREMLLEKGLQLPIITDEQESLAKKCGVYATPQAVILDPQQRLYYRGNYNRSRYCTDKNTNYVQQALEALAAGKEAPQFSQLATTAWGCELTQQQNALTTLLNF